MLRRDAVHGQKLAVAVCLVLSIAVCGGCRRSPEAKKAKFMQSGKAFMEAQDYPRAILQFRNAAQFAGKDAEPYYQLGLAFLADGQLESGVAALNRTLKVNPKHSAARLKLLELEARFGTHDIRAEANRNAEQVVAASPDDPDALSTLALTELSLGRAADAENHLKEALEKSPQNVKAAVAMAQVKARQGDLKGAEELLQATVQKVPKSADPLVALASFYAVSKRWPDAEQALQKALQLDPKNQAALLSLAAVEIRSGHKEQAEQTYARISALPPARFKPLHAQFLFQEGKRDAAIAEFAKLAKDNPDDRTARTRLVAAYWAANRRADAEKVLTDALKHNAKDVDALTQRSEIEVVNGRFAEAQTDADQVLRYRSDSAPAHFVKARVYRSHGEGALERQELGEALRLNKNLLGARLELAQSLLQQHDGKAALAVLDSKDVQEQQKRTLPVYVLHNYALLETGDYDDAKKYVDAALAQVKTPDLLIQDALIKGNKKDYAGARVSLESALKLNPENLRALELLGKTYASQNQLAVATQKIREHVASQPKSARLQKFLGDWLAATGDHTGALQAYAAAKQLDPQLTGADMSMARLYVADNKNDEARQILTRLLQGNGNNAEAYLWMGVLDERAEKYDAASADYRKVLTAESNNLMALNNLAFLLAEHGQAQQLDEALKLAQQVRALVPKSGNVDDTMGWVYYKKGMYQSAVAQLQDAVAQDPSPLHHYHLAMAYLKSSDSKRGNEELNKALKLNPNLPEAKQAMALLAQTKTASN